MGLGIYTEADDTTQISMGSYDNPLRITLDSKQDDVVETLLYVRSDDGSFTDIVVEPVAISLGKNLIDNDGYTWKLKAGATQPTTSEWDSIDAADSVSLGTVEDTETYLPFWLRVSVPRGATVSSYQHVVLRITAEEIV